MVKSPQPAIPQPPPMPIETAPAIDWLLKYYIPSERQTPKLLAAIERYKKAASEPPAIEAYIDSHLKDGLTANEWTLFTTGLALRVLPTLGDLFGHETDFRKANLHSSTRTDNYNDEAGDGKKLQAHPALYIDSLRVVDQKLGVTTPNDMAIYTMALHIIQLRKLNPPVYFPPIPQAANNVTPDMDLLESFAQRQADASSPEAFEATMKNHQAFERFKVEVLKINNGRPLTLPYQMEGMDGSRKQKDAPEWPHGVENYFGAAWFAKACEIADRMPDDTINYYDAILADKHDHHPNDSLSLLTRELNTLTREGNAPTHIGTYDRLLRAHEGYFGRDAKRALLWSDIHVNPKHGVEKDHAADLVAEFISMLRKNLLDKQMDPDMLAEVFDHVVDRGYIAQQKHHWESVVAAMEKARAASPTPPIVPKAKGRFVEKLDLEGLAHNGLANWVRQT